MNTVIIMGNITRDVELKYLPSGTALATFGIAYNDSYKNADGNRQESTSFFDVTAFGRRAEVVNQHFAKGRPILIRGKLKQESWTSQDGSKRSKVSIVLEEFDFLPCKQNDRRDHCGKAYQSSAPTQAHNQATETATRPQPSKQQTMDEYEDDIPF